MQPYLSDTDFTLYNGDALETLRELPAESVHMCVTSPPFFGLRDYGTGTWEGGDAGCDHDQRRREQDPNSKQATSAGSSRDGLAGRVDCRKCGARRVDRQIGLEQTPEDWVASLVAVFEEVRRVLRKGGVLFVECGDSYNADHKQGRSQDYQERTGGNTGLNSRNARTHEGRQAPGCKPKDLMGTPFLLAFALRDAGWYWRNVCIWHKPNPMPESVRDRFTVSHSYVLLFSKGPRYFFDAEAVREGNTEDALIDAARRRQAPGKSSGNGETSCHHGGYATVGPTAAGRNARSVWSIATEPLPFEHYAAFPQALAERCIKAGSAEGDTVLDCFGGSGTTALVARRLNRKAILVELNPTYCELIARRTQQLSLEAETA